jgi:hypothetical protein
MSSTAFGSSELNVLGFKFYVLGYWSSLRSGKKRRMNRSRRVAPNLKPITYNLEPITLHRV